MSAGRVESNDPYSRARSKLIIWPLVLLVAGQLWLVRASLLAPLTVARTGGWTVDRMAWALVQCVIAGAVLVLLWRVARVSRYRPVEGLADHLLPEITVVVPAFNEGRQVYKTLESIVAGDYPADKLHVVAVNDGSADDTWTWMERAAADFGERITAVNCRVNRGKRAVLAEGFVRARGTVLVTIDSDSMIDRGTLRNLVSPFVVDPRIGAVAGNVRVLPESGFIARMLDVSFTYAFELIRASESVVDTVTCCPGALSAFRRDLVDRVLEPWLHQTFLGVPAKIGEDRAMTNFILRMGFLVRFQSNAIVRTDVPKKLPQLCRMLLRWGRSNVRETIALAGFVYTRFRKGSAWGARIDLTWTAIQMIARVVTYPMFIVLVLTRPMVIGWVALAFVASALLPAAVYALIRGGARTRALWAFAYALYSPICLAWIAPYALFTVRQSAWLTRGRPAQLPARVQNDDAEIPVLAPRDQPIGLSA